MTTKKLIFFASLMLIFTGPQAVEARPLIMAFQNTEARPFKWKENGKFIGPILDIMREAFQRMDTEIKLTPQPPKRIVRNLETAKIDGTFGLSRKVDREKHGDYLETPIGWYSTNIFVNKGDEFPFTKLEDIYGKKIGTVRGVALGKAFHVAVTKGDIKPKESPDYKSLVQMLTLKRVDMAASPTSPFLKNAEQIGLADKIVKLPHPLRPTVSLHVIMSKTANFPNKKEQVEKLEAALSQMEKDKVFERIYAKYGYVFDIR